MNTLFDPELSRLAFEDRLIEFCEDENLPLLERVRLLGITAGRIDVFFMTRVGRLQRLIASGYSRRSNGGLSPAEQQEAVAIEAHRIARRAYDLLDRSLFPALATHGIGIDDWGSLDAAERAHLHRACISRFTELVRPQFVDPTHDFPHVRNLRPALVATARRNGETSVVVVELPAEMPRLVALPRAHRFVPLEQVIAAELPALCHDLEIDTPHLFRVTRNAYTDYEEERDVLAGVEQEVVRRPFQEVVRLEVQESMPVELRDNLLHQFHAEAETPAPSLSGRDTYVVRGLIDLTALEIVADVDVPVLQCPPVPRRATRIDPGLLEGKAGGQLLHFPFDDYTTSIEHFLAEAAHHPRLARMETTIYRTDEKSGVIAALRAARDRGAEVSVVVELKASFDERENIELARSLESDGIRVILSPASLKVHAKMAHVALRDGEGLHHVGLIGTGNMNAITARSYIDLWLATADTSCAREVGAVFDVLNGRVDQADFDCLLVAPFNMRRRFLELIEREIDHAIAGKQAGIRAMINGLTDPAVIAALYRASQAGVPIDLMVRGICELRPGQPDISDHIRVVSVAGHLLQHARIFHFRNADDDAYFIGSADWRPRNFDGRIEVVTSIREAQHVALLDRILTDTLDAPEAWVLGADGAYTRVYGTRTQVTLSPS